MFLALCHVANIYLSLPIVLLWLSGTCPSLASINSYVQNLIVSQCKKMGPKTA